MNRLRREAAQTESEPARRPAPGDPVVALFGLVIGLLLMAIQLWLLTLAFDLYQSGERAETVGVAVASGLVFLGGLVMLRVVGRRPRLVSPSRSR